MIRERFKAAFKPVDTKDLGLGTKADKDFRSMNKDGSFNVRRVGQGLGSSWSPFHYLLSLSWTKFTMLVVTNFLAINFFFATIYYLIGMEHMGGSEAETELEQYLDAFFFSVQTYTTVGYGRLSPVGLLTSAVASLEALTGILTVALSTGLLYGRFSKPNAKILYSNNSIIAPYRGITAWEFRMANARDNELVEVEVQVTCSKIEEVEGEAKRKFYNLPLERDKINFFPLPWIVVHPIDENSPIFGLTEDEIKKARLEFYVIIKAFDDTFSQTVYSRTSYSGEEILIGARFVNNFSRKENKHTVVELDKLNETVPAELYTEIVAPTPAEVVRS